MILYNTISYNVMHNAILLSLPLPSPLRLRRVQAPPSSRYVYITLAIIYPPLK